MTAKLRSMALVPGAALAIVALAASLPVPGAAPAVAATAATDVAPAEPGTSIETAIRLEGVKGEMSGVHAEYVYIRERYPDWNTTDQAVFEQEGRIYDRINIVGPRGEKKAVFFDITDWFGKME